MVLFGYKVNNTGIFKGICRFPGSLRWFGTHLRRFIIYPNSFFPQSFCLRRCTHMTPTQLFKSKAYQSPLIPLFFSPSASNLSVNPTFYTCRKYLKISSLSISNATFQKWAVLISHPASTMVYLLLSLCPLLSSILPFLQSSQKDLLKTPHHFLAY